ncbi:hypothetical protein B0H14DRAFT_587392 [Mycena olivaceomarginata]|nr:hypothetical protein B0H14DRAFT_587392 [Mycena olivaceomarginata]
MSASMSEPEDVTVRCSACKTDKSFDLFRLKPDGTRYKTCISCNSRTSAANRQRRSDAKGNVKPREDAEENTPDTDLAVVPLRDFLDAVTEQDDYIELEARVNIASLSGSRRERADELAKAIWNKRSYRFIYHSKYDHKRTAGTRFKYHCAQISSRQHRPKKYKREGTKTRDKISMDAFPCKGWLHITVNDGEDVASVSLSHADDHVPYYSIDVPAEVVDYVHGNHKLPLGELWNGVLKIIPNPSFTRKVIGSMVSELNATEWRRDPDELKSARALLKEFQHPEPAPNTGKKPLYSIEPIPVHEEPGFIAIAFCLPQILREVVYVNSP